MVLQVEGAGPSDQPEWRTWDSQELSVSRLRRILVEQRPTCVGVRAVPNGRLAAEMELLGHLRGSSTTLTVEQLRQARPVNEGDAVDPDALYALAGECGYGIDLRWSGDGRDGRYDAVFTRGGDAAQPFFEAPQVVDGRPALSRTYANNPLHGLMTRKLVPQLRAFLEARLPPYFVPAVFVLLDSLPLSPNGKVDRRALPLPGRARLDLRDTFVAPRTAAEEAIAAIFGDILGLDRVGVSDSFFQLGGHSLLATQLVSRVRDTFGVELLLRRVFEAPTVALLAEVVEERSSTKSRGSRIRKPSSSPAPSPARWRGRGMLKGPESGRRSELSAAKRALLEKRLRGGSSGSVEAIARR